MTWRNVQSGPRAPGHRPRDRPRESAGDLGLDAGRPALAQRRRRRHLVPAPRDSDRSESSLRAPAAGRSAPSRDALPRRRSKTCRGRWLPSRGTAGCRSPRAPPCPAFSSLRPGPRSAGPRRAARLRSHRGSRSAATAGGPGACAAGTAAPDSADGRLAPSDPDTLYGLTPTPRDQCLTRSDDAGAHWQALALPPAPPAGSDCSDVAVDPRDARHVWVAAQSHPRERRHEPDRSNRATAASTSRAAFSAPADGLVAAGGEMLYTGSIQDAGFEVSQRRRAHLGRIDQGIVAGDLRDGLVAQRLPGGGGGRRLLVLEHAVRRRARTASTAATAARTGSEPLSEPRPDRRRGRLDRGGRGSAGRRPEPERRRQLAGRGLRAAAARGLPARRGTAALPGAPRPSRTTAPTATSPCGRATTAARPGAGPATACRSPALTSPRSTSAPISPPTRSIPSIPTAAGCPASTPIPSSLASSSAKTPELPGRWRRPSPTLLALAADPHVPGRLLAGTYDGLFVSEDAGAHWLPLGDLPAGAVIRQFAYDPPRNLVRRDDRPRDLPQPRQRSPLDAPRRRPRPRQPDDRGRSTQAHGAPRRVPRAGGVAVDAVRGWPAGIVAPRVDLVLEKSSPHRRPGVGGEGEMEAVG